MTWLWRICFSGLLLAPALAGTVSGSVELANSRDPGVRKHRDYSGVVVWLDPAEGPAPLAPAKTVSMLQKGKQFQPHVLAIPIGTTVDFPNLDPIFHNAFSNFAGQPFDTGLYAPGTSQRVQFRREGIVRVFCNIHSSMSAVIVVVRTPHVAVTGRDGAFRFANLPPGDYRLHVWHERATEDTLKGLGRKIAVQGADLKLAPILVSESGYLEIPHKNKYGKDYPAESDPPGYGGRR